MKEELKQLWKDTFGDTDTYLDLFFNHVYKEENVVVQYKGGKLIAALHLIPYQMTLNGKIIPVSYICGVATIPEERGKGIMTSLMQEAHMRLRERGDELAVLIPVSNALFNYYEKMGYRNFFYYHKTLYKGNFTDTDSGLKLVSGKDIPEQHLFDFFDQQTRRRKVTILHNYTDFTHILQEVYLSGGSVKILTDHVAGIKAMAFLYPEGENEILIKELIYENETYKQIILHKIWKENPSIPLVIRSPWTAGEKTPFGMVYTINQVLNPFIQAETGFMSLMLE